MILENVNSNVIRSIVFLVGMGRYSAMQVKTTSLISANLSWNYRHKIFHQKVLRSVKSVAQKFIFSAKSHMADFL